MTTDTLKEVLEKQKDIPSYLERDLDVASKDFSELSDDDLTAMRRRIKDGMGVESAQEFDKYVKENK